MALRSNSDIVKGSRLMVFLEHAGATAGATSTFEPIGFATNHSLSMTLNTSSVSTKDNGDYPSVIPQNISYEVQCENLYSQAGEQTYMALMQDMKEVTLRFGEAGNYSNSEAQIGLPLEQNTDWSLGATGSVIVAEGKALVTSFSMNAPAGDNATMSVTFTGSGSLKTSGF